MPQNISSQDNQVKNTSQSVFQPDEKDHRNKVKKIDLMVFIVVAFLGIYSHIYFQEIRDYLLFSHSVIEKVEDQVQLAGQIGFYFGVIGLANWTLAYIVAMFCRDAVTYSARSSLERFVIFIGIYLFLLNKASMNKSVKYYIIAANWFLFSECLYMIGIIIDSPTKSNIRYAGTILMVPIGLSAMNKIAEYNGFPYI